MSLEGSERRLEVFDNLHARLAYDLVYGPITLDGAAALGVARTGVVDGMPSLDVLTSDGEGRFVSRHRAAVFAVAGLREILVFTGRDVRNEGVELGNPEELLRVYDRIGTTAVAGLRDAVFDRLADVTTQLLESKV